MRVKNSGTFVCLCDGKYITVCGAPTLYVQRYGGIAAALCVLSSTHVLALVTKLKLLQQQFSVLLGLPVGVVMATKGQWLAVLSFPRDIWCRADKNTQV